MQFESADPSVIRSITQRALMNTWLRVRPSRDALPSLADFNARDVSEDRADMMSFDVIGQGDDARFLITYEGARLTTAYGNEHVAPAQRTNRYLDDAIGADRYARVLPPYRTCLLRQRPTYTVSTVHDADGKDVSYERLLLPFGTGDTVTQLIGSYKAISIEGGFRLDNLMGVTPKAVPMIVLRAVIDRAFEPPPDSPNRDSVDLV